jgi:FkbM family methyltransferase
MSIKLITKSIWNNPGNRGKRLQKTFQAVAWQLQKRTLRAPRLLKLQNGSRFKAYPDCVISSALIYADWPEYEELTFLRRHLKQDDCVVDIGANVGHISMLLVDLVGPRNVWAIEPTPVTYQRLLENWKLNGWPATGLIHAAIGAKQGTIFASDARVPCTTARVSALPSSDNTVEVPMMRLDDLRFLWSERRVGLLKIDVEGCEVDVFRGATQFLRVERPLFIMFESLTGRLDEEIESILSAAEYDVFQLGEDGNPDFKSASAQNLFAIPRERHSSLLGS